MPIPKPAEQPGIVRARLDALQLLDRQMVLRRPLAADRVHQQVAAAVEGGARRPGHAVDARQLGCRIARPVDVLEEEPQVTGVLRLVEVDLLALPEERPGRRGGGLRARSCEREAEADRQRDDGDERHSGGDSHPSEGSRSERDANTHAATLVAMSTVETKLPTCYRHPDRETGSRAPNAAGPSAPTA
jgi:hypothetical protein